MKLLLTGDPGRSAVLGLPPTQKKSSEPSMVQSSCVYPVVVRIPSTDIVTWTTKHREKTCYTQKAYTLQYYCLFFLSMTDFPICFFFSETHFHVCFHFLFSCFVFFYIILSSLISWKTASLQRNQLVRVSKLPILQCQYCPYCNLKVLQQTQKWCQQKVIQVS